MEKDAFIRLEKLSLPFPKTYQLEPLIQEASPDSLYFLRYHHNNKLDLPRYVSSEYLSKHSTLFRRLAAEGQITQIAETVVTLIGGCVVTRGNERYIELVSGHVSGLLLYGWCCARSHISNNGTVTILTPQMQMVEQLPYVNQISRAKFIDLDLLSHLAHSCEALLQEVSSKYLLEFIVDNNHRLCFVDIKDYDWQIDFANLAAEAEEECFLYKHSDRSDVLANIYDGNFSLDNLVAIQPSTTIRLADRALLSHFITYSLNKGIAGIIK